MRLRPSARSASTWAVALSLCVGGSPALGQEPAAGPLTLASGRVSIAGTSNIHAYTASTTAVRVTRVRLAPSVAGPDFWEAIVKPGAVEAFEITIPAATLSSAKADLDKNMHKALKVKEHADITFRLIRVDPRAGPAGALRAVGVLQVAGVEREVALDITTVRKDGGLSVQGRVDLLMTDFGIAPPKAMLGMLKTDPKVTLSFDTVLSVPLT